MPSKRVLHNYRARVALEDAAQVNLVAQINRELLVRSLPKVYERVVAICELKPQVTGHYGLLIWYYYNRYHRGFLNYPFDMLHSVPSPESITRAFRKAVENGEVKPTEKILKRREMREEAIRRKIVKLGCE